MGFSIVQAVPVHVEGGMYVTGDAEKACDAIAKNGLVPVVAEVADRALTEALHKEEKKDISQNTKFKP
jgi:hypothetical protein